MFHFVPIVSGPVAGHHWREHGSTFFAELWAECAKYGVYFNKRRLIRDSKEYLHFMCILKLIIQQKWQKLWKKGAGSYVSLKKYWLIASIKVGALDFYNFD